jgi:flagellar protein FliO/FliZ
LIRVGQQFILIASSGKNIEFLSEIKLEDYNPPEVQENNTLFDFKNLFEKYLQNFNKSKAADIGKDLKKGVLNGTAEGEKIKSNLNRLRMINTGAPKQGKENEGG